MCVYERLMCDAVNSKKKASTNVKKKKYTQRRERNYILKDLVYNHILYCFKCLHVFSFSRGIILFSSYFLFFFFHFFLKRQKIIFFLFSFGFFGVDSQMVNISLKLFNCEKNYIRVC